MHAWDVESWDSVTPDGEHHIMFDFVKDKKGYRHFQIENIADWQAVRLCPVGPCEVSKTRTPNTRPRGVGLVTVGIGGPIVQVAARRGFRFYQVAHLKLLWAYLKVPGSRTRIATTATQLASGCVKKSLPGLLPADYDECMSWRD